MGTVRNYILAIPLLCCSFLLAQPRVTVPWSNVLNEDFGTGSSPMGGPIKNGFSHFTYTTDPCPAPGQYTTAKAAICPQFKPLAADAGHFFMFANRMPGDSGYMMLATNNASPDPRILFTDTLHNLCQKTTYLFWAAMMNASKQTCIYPNFTMQVQTLGGQLIQSWQTGNIGSVGDRGTYYPGYFDHIPIKGFAYYGGTVTLPAGVSDVIATIIANPSNADSHCTWNAAIDNILFMSQGPDVTIAAPAFSGGWISGSCIDGAFPVKMNAVIGKDYLEFGTPDRVPATYSQPGYQWQGSVDGGFTWSDLPNQNAAQLSYVINQLPGMYVRVRVSEETNISNLNCSTVSNILHVIVDTLPAGAGLSANSPVCTDADLIFTQA
ncbi:MAG: hypothetical protein KGO82_19320, partial [Bacteroidota bacterium]|nr:hypothetical protein [Bacteroidota bacterium]